MRLIDADALKKAIPNTHVDIFENCRNCRLLDDEQVKQIIDDAPTIELLKEQEKPNGKCVNECECWDSAYERGKQDALKEQEVKAGKWITKIRHEHYPSGKQYEEDFCSVCGKRGSLKYQFCPNCGAKMEGR